jgi:hypothetical protein
MKLQFSKTVVVFVLLGSGGALGVGEQAHWFRSFFRGLKTEAFPLKAEEGVPGKTSATNVLAVPSWCAKLA